MNTKEVLNKLIAEIERKIGICEKQRSDAIKVECYDLADDASARMGELHVILETITSLQQEQPPLPSNLDEAARMYRNYREECGIKDPVMLNEIEEAHYAGAEWMAEQDHLPDAGKMVEPKHIADVSKMMEQQEADLEKEVINYFEGYWPGMETAAQCNTQMRFTPPAIMRLVKHFYERGLTAGKDEWLKDRDVCFWDGVEEGKKAMEKQMMKELPEAGLKVRAKYMKTLSHDVYVESEFLDIDPESVKVGDEVIIQVRKK